MAEEKSLGREFLGFVPLFLLHVSIGMMGSFTTILILLLFIFLLILPLAIITIIIIIILIR